MRITRITLWIIQQWCSLLLDRSLRLSRLWPNASTSGCAHQIWLLLWVWITYILNNLLISILHLLDIMCVCWWNYAFYNPVLWLEELLIISWVENGVFWMTVQYGVNLDCDFQPGCDCVVGKEVPIKIAFQNPLPCVLKNAIFRIEGLGLKHCRSINYG